MENILENTNQRITTLRRTRNASQADIIENKAWFIIYYQSCFSDFNPFEYFFFENDCN